MKMKDQVRIEQKDGKFAIILTHHNHNQEMDVRETYPDAESYAFYLARSMNLDVYYLGQKVVPRTRR
jgi:hypothetical protein